LGQGSRSVAEYGELFNKLARYTPDDVSTNAKRQSEFIRDLNDELSLELVAITFNSYQQLALCVVCNKVKARQSIRSQHDY
jgi:hypothetical protein